ncbi:hypothetical protein [Leptolyngbya sp. FACHB-711]|uniref:hypothetical protein n=1 Tax=unclassified Leptolyngbya TaxID=2650499 RepID=UPI001688DB87|nr:hypothetical protein [Cyanobacteria bacterium FACHB-502]MBD2027850.1 hypothetical protein [Leptolyngbya sp. FACHB-711]
MSLQEVQELALQLSASDRRTLLQFITESLEDVPEHPNDSSASLAPIEALVRSTASTKSQARRAAAIRQMGGLLKTDQPTPTDAEVQKLLEERRIEKYLQ